MLDRLDGLQVPIGSALKDLRSIAESVKTIPQLTEHLAKVATHSARLDDEVQQMRAEVVRIREEVAQMSTSLDTKLDEVGSALHPLRRTFGRFGRSEVEDAPEEG